MEMKFNLETTKLELHFAKSDYDALTDKVKKELKSYFLWSNYGKCWVSRCKEPNLYHARKFAESIGFSKETRTGERLSYAEQIEAKAERAEARAERYEQYAANAEKRAENLQKPLNSMHGDIAFFTQPIIAGHSGSQAFARRRERMYNSYHKGMEEYKKSEYFRDRANTAQGTATMAQLTNKPYLMRKIKECTATEKHITENIVKLENRLYRLENGETLTRYDGTNYTIEDATEQLEIQLELYEVNQDKQAFFENKLDELGGVAFNIDNIEIGYIVELQRCGKCEVVGKGKENISYTILTGGAKGLGGKAAYAEIVNIIEATKAKKECHNFTVGEHFNTISTEYAKDGSWSYTKHNLVWEIVKVSDASVSVKVVSKDGEAVTDSKPITRKPRKTSTLRNNDVAYWEFWVDDRYENRYTKAV